MPQIHKLMMLSYFLYTLYTIYTVFNRHADVYSNCANRNAGIVQRRGCAFESHNVAPQYGAFTSAGEIMSFVLSLTSWPGTVQPFSLVISRTTKLMDWDETQLTLEVQERLYRYKFYCSVFIQLLAKKYTNTMSTSIINIVTKTLDSYI